MMNNVTCLSRIHACNFNLFKYYYIILFIYYEISRTKPIIYLQVEGGALYKFKY